MPRHRSVSEKTEFKLREGVEFAKRYEESFDMFMWMRKQGAPLDMASEIPALTKCGTTGCLAAFICLAHWMKEPNDTRFIDWSIRGLAEEIAGLHNYQTNDLFVQSHWPEPFLEEYERAEGKVDEVKILERRVKHFIEYGR